MKTKKLSELSTEELTKQKKTLQGVLIGTMVIMALLCAALLYLVMKNHNSALLAIFPALFVIMVPGIIRYSQLNTELKTRTPGNS